MNNDMKYSIPDALFLQDFEEKNKHSYEKKNNEDSNDNVERIYIDNFQSTISNNLYYNIVKNEQNKMTKKQKTRKNREV